MADVPVRATGTVRWFSGQKGFGFIAPDYGGDDLFVHQTSILSDGFRTLYDGGKVEFTVDCGEDGRTKAVDVVGLGRSHRPAGDGGRRGGYGARGDPGRGGSYIMYDGGYGQRGRAGRRGGGGGYDAVDRGGYGGGRGSYGGGGGGYGGSGGGGGACYNCGRLGHLARDCYQGSGGGRPRYGGGYSSGGGGACYNCGEEGHFARDCPIDEN